jgi:inner membrane protein
MASLGHLAVGAALGRRWSGRRGWAVAGFAALAMLPDLDAIGFKLGVPYPAPWGHRGAAHSVAIAVIAAVIGWAVAPAVRSPRLRLAGYVFVCVASHGLLDAMTTGGLGVALFWPLSAHRFFLPWRPIPVSPIGAGMLSARGLRVLAWEALAFAPAWFYALRPQVQRKAIGSIVADSPAIRISAAPTLERSSPPTERGSAE